MMLSRHTFHIRNIPNPLDRLDDQGAVGFTHVRNNGTEEIVFYSIPTGASYITLIWTKPNCRPSLGDISEEIHKKSSTERTRIFLPWESADRGECNGMQIFDFRRGLFHIMGELDAMFRDCAFHVEVPSATTGRSMNQGLSSKIDEFLNISVKREKFSQITDAVKILLEYASPEEIEECVGRVIMRQVLQT